MIGISPSLTAVNSEIPSLPLSARPIAILSFVHSNVVTPSVLIVVNTTGPINAPFETTILSIQTRENQLILA